MWQRLCEIVNAAPGHRILVIGDYMLDRYLYGDAERISPEAPVPVLRVVQQSDAVGGAGSVAMDIAALGAVPACAGLLGNDADGAVVRDLLTKAGADISGLIADSARPTTRKTRLIGLAQHRHRQQLIRIDDERTDGMDVAIARTLKDRIDAVIDNCHAVCIEDYAKGVINPALTAHVLTRARSRSIPVLVDPAPIGDYTPYRGATVVTPNRTETERLIGRRLRSVAAVRDAAAEIHRACGTQYVCVTLDAEGAGLIHPDGTFEHVPTKARDVYDVTGAGDEVLAAMAVALSVGASMSEASSLANVAGGLEVEKFGCVPIGRDEILGELYLENHRELGKVRSLEQLLPELTRRRALGNTIAFTNGCFDLLHAGHAHSFAFARRHADILVVGLNSDASVARLGKGAGRPFMRQADRAALLAALTDVDYVTIFEDDTPLRLIEAVRPDFLVKGADWSGKTVVGQDVVERYGGKVLLAPLVEGLSTTSLVARIRESR